MTQLPGPSELENMDDEQKHSCARCMAIFSRRNYLLQHLRNTHGPGVECTYCHKLFSCKETMKEHIKLIHQHKKLKCLQCGKEYRSRSGLHAHMLGHKGQQKQPCPICNKKLYYSHLKRHLETHKDVKERKTVQCKECNSTFFEKDKLSRHMLIHRGDNRKKCPICHQGCVNLSDHIKTHTDRSVTCKVCNKVLKSKQCLASHMQLHDKNRKRYSCNVCQKPFPLKTTLNKHLHMHNGDDIVYCQKCNGKYKKGNLRRHLQNVHGEKESQICTQCGRVYPNQLCLSRHIKSVHEALKVSCSVCGKEYTSKAALKAHLKIHANRKKKFVCNMCKKSFFTKGALDKHILIHSGINKRVCAVCNGMYANIKNHMKTHMVHEKHTIE